MDDTAMTEHRTAQPKRMSYKPVAAALRALEVLSAVNRLNGAGSVKEIHQQTSIDKATIIRMLETLMAGGYVTFDAQTRRYGVTGRTLSLSSAYDRHKAYGDIVLPFLHEFTAEVGWPSDVAIPDGDAMLIIETSRVAGPLSFNRSAGFRSPMLGTSLGLAYMAHCTPLEQDRILQGLEYDNAPWNQIALDPNKLSRKLSRIRKLGYAVMDEDYSKLEYVRLVSTVGVPIMHKDTIYATMNVIYLKRVITAERAEEELLQPLKEIAAKMGAALAERVSPP